MKIQTERSTKSRRRTGAPRVETGNAFNSMLKPSSLPLQIFIERASSKDEIRTANELKGTQTMLVVHVHVRVKPECVEPFKAASIANARESIREPGIARFDVVQQQDDSSRFVLVEVYRSPEAAAAHKATPHYETWRDAVAPMMAEPRSSVKFTNLFPDDANW